MKATWIIGLAVTAAGLSACSGTAEDAQDSVAVSDTSGTMQDDTMQSETAPADGNMTETPVMPTDTPLETMETPAEPDPAAT